MTSLNGNLFHVTGHLCGEFTCEFPTQRPVTRSFVVFFDLRLTKWLSKQWWGWWFGTPSCPLWRQRNACLPINFWGLVPQPDMPSIKITSPGIFERNVREVIFMLILIIDSCGISGEKTLRWMALDITGDKSAKVQVMIWCRQALSYHLSQCWYRFMSP